ncbi:MAG: 3',5'-cyclic-nucleotide phosphodiesterase [Zoogloeaceae bacterium]|nr:3',5'-cyclic-nucleotide phosphodiesterase [Rhodocyclaceae bacterium]MCP5241032.1 3',5'-cyclic-nucleotide phosphodiesterase [Zoogloeaceae bacterium]MCP5255657.1 3',5'-cyclic-nucleotide phosphodiesterase [Zoogloeaceae bacterium]MCP5294650.1 3',5'-cyclic-nucleotide phosphodiesterase [Zoogloeaceae bacterium]MCW5616505.1 3',5'-cyclic-nucleotide phosphodiesterase [Rhodocyclaceae bacterium]
MKLTVLGCSGGIGGAERRTTAFLVDDDILIDGGSGVGDLSYEALLRIDHIFITHAHLDHVAFIPFLVDTVGDERQRPITLHGTRETLHILRSHLFNWLVWPDFSTIPDRNHPFLRYQEVAVGDVIELGGRKIKPMPAHHTVPAVGYSIDSGKGQLAFTGDTTYSKEVLAAINALPNLRHLIIEAAFPDALQGLALASRHLCPALLAMMLNELEVRPDVYVTHLKPGKGKRIMAEIGAYNASMPVHRLRQGMVLEF